MMGTTTKEPEAAKGPMVRRRCSLLCSAVIAAAVIVAWCAMTFSIGDSGELSAPGIGSLKYFTVLSNLLEGAASLIYIFALLPVLRGRRGGVPRWVLTLKLAGAVSVGLTFVTVMLFLGPIFGYSHMFLGANLWFHLLVPLMAMAEYILLVGEEPLPFRATLWAALPMLLYGVCYLANLLIHYALAGGLIGWPNAYDLYGFTIWGLPVGIGIFAVIILITWGIAVLLRWGNERLQKKKIAA